MSADRVSRGREKKGLERARWITAVLCLAAALCLAGLGCGVGTGGWKGKELSAQTVEWQEVKGQHLLDVLATPSIGPRRVDLLLCRWQTGVPIRVAWPANATERERVAFERARVAWSSVVEGLELVDAENDAETDIRVAIVGADDPLAPSGTADTVTDCVVDAGASALADPAERGRIVGASIVMRRENVDWAGATSPMSDDELLGTVLHELGHALGIAGHLGGWRARSVMSAELSAVRRVARRVAKGGKLEAPTMLALYTVPLGTGVGVTGFSSRLRPSLDALADLAAEEGWRGPFGRAGGDSAHVFWQTPGGSHPGVLTFEWSNGVRGKRALAWRLSVSARTALGAAADADSAP